MTTELLVAIAAAGLALPILLGVYRSMERFTGRG